MIIPKSCLALSCLIVPYGALADADISDFTPDHSDSAADLAQDLANPLASIVSLPAQLNFDQGLGPDGDGHRTTLNFQPVYPFDLGDGSTLLARLILPWITQSDVRPGGGTQSGFGDALLVAWYVPPPGDHLTWGIGPALQFPGDTEVASGTWAAGFTALAVYTSGPWTTGVNFNHLWDIESDPRVDIDRSFLQPFFSYSTPGALTYAFQAELSYDWISETWSVPVAAQINKLAVVGSAPVNFGAGVGYWVDAPDNGPEGWRFRLQAQVVLPR